VDQIKPEWFHPRGVVLGPDGLLYVVNAPNIFRGVQGEVWRFDPEGGKFVDKFIPDKGGATGNCTDRLNQPAGLTFSPDGRLSVTTYRARGTDRVTLNSAAAFVFEDPINEQHPGIRAKQATFSARGATSGSRAFVHFALFRPGIHLFVETTGNSAHAGAVDRYDIRYHKFTVPNLVTAEVAPPSAIGGATRLYYASFGEEGHGTLIYDEAQDERRRLSPRPRASTPTADGTLRRGVP
jgi:hypothetical protein